MVRALLVLFLLCSCVQDLDDIPDTAAFTCSTNADCPDEQVCVVQAEGVGSLCSRADAPCLETVGGTTRASPDGTRCSADAVADGLGVCNQARCVAGACGDGIRDLLAEECDDGATNSDVQPNTCRTDCRLPRCGDGVMDGDEACDDGNASDDDGCLSNCELNTCGDGIVNTLAEECDNGALTPTGPCLPGCINNVCGDGALHVGVESCEDLNEDPNDGCFQCRFTEWQVDDFLGFGSDSGPSERLDLSIPGDIVRDSRGNAYVSDTARDVVWRIELATGRAFRFAGGAPVSTALPAPAAQVVLSRPSGLALDRDGNLYIGERRRILRVDARSQIASLVAGSTDGCTEPSCYGDGGSTFAARFNQIEDIALSPNGDIYVADILADRVRAIDASTLTVSTVANLGTPASVALGTDGRLYVTTRDFSAGHNVFRFFPGSFPIRVAGNGSTCGGLGSCGDGGPATSAALFFPEEIAVAADGRVFVADSTNRRVRSFTVGGVITTAIGSTESCVNCETNTATTDATGNPEAVTLYDEDRRALVVTNDLVFDVDLLQGTMRRVAGTPLEALVYDGTAATTVEPREVRRVAAADNGISYVISQAQEQLLRVDPDGLVSQVTGLDVCDDPAGPCGDGGPANAFRTNPRAIGTDAAANLYFFDQLTRRIRHVAPNTGLIRSVAGNGDTCTAAPFDCGDGGRALEASFSAEVVDLQPDTRGGLYVADRAANRIRYIAPDGDIETVWGTGNACGSRACGDGLAGNLAPIESPRTVDVSPEGDVYALDDSGRVRRLSAARGTVQTLLPSGSRSAFTLLRSGTPGFLASEDQLVEYDLSGNNRTIRYGTTGDCGFFGQPATEVCYPGSVFALATRADGSIFVAPTSVHVVTPEGTVLQYLGEGNGQGLGKFEVANLQRGGQLASRPDAPMLVANGSSVVTLNPTVRELRPAVGFVGAPSDTEDARFFGALEGATGVAVDPATGDFWVSDADTHQIYLVEVETPTDPAGWTITRFSGRVDSGSQDGPVADAQFNQPAGLAFDPTDGALYVADRGNHLIRRIQGGQVTTVAGAVGDRGPDSDSGSGIVIAEARFDAPEAVTVDANGSVLVADTGHHRVRRIDFEADRVETVLGDGAPLSPGEGVEARFASITSPIGLDVDSAGNLFVANTTTIVQVLSGDDGFADGSDTIRVLYGRPPRSRLPESATSCLTGLTLSAAEDQIVATDRCTGFAVVVNRRFVDEAASE